MSTVTNRSVTGLLAQKIVRLGALAVSAIDRVLKGRAAYALAALGVLAIQNLLIFTHRPWLDEWQALQIALESPSVPDLFQNLRYEGHPPLWYFILRALAEFIPPLWVLPAAAAICAAIAQALVLFKSPFQRAEKVLISLGCLLLFEFMTISRSMSLGVMLLLVAVAFWRIRWSWVAIALLPMCDLLFGVASGVLVILKLRDGRWSVAGVALWLGASLFAAWSVVPASDMAPALRSSGLLFESASYLLRSGLLLLPLQFAGLTPAWNASPLFGTGALLALAFYLLAWRELKCDKLQVTLFFGFVFFTFAFSLAVYPLAARHLMLIALLLILFNWLRGAEGETTSPRFRTWVLAGAVCGMFVGLWNLIYPFDTAHVAANEIRRRGLSGKHWVAFPDSRGQGVSALTGIKFESTEGRCWQTFVRWNNPQALDTMPELRRYLEKTVSERGRFYLLTDVPLRRMPAELVSPIASTSTGYDQFTFYLWVIGRDHPDSRIQLPDCARRLPPLAAALKTLR